MCMDAMYKAADGKKWLTQANALIYWIFNSMHGMSKNNGGGSILAKNLDQGNQWLEDSTLENSKVDEDDNFYAPETAAHKFVESDDETSTEEIS